MFRLLFVALLLACSLAPPCRAPAAWSERPITITVPFGAGGNPTLWPDCWPTA